MDILQRAMLWTFEVNLQETHNYESQIFNYKICLLKKLPLFLNLIQPKIDWEFNLAVWRIDRKLPN